MKGNGGLTWRSVLIATALTLLISFWVEYNSLVYNGPDLVDHVPPAVPRVVIALLFVGRSFWVKLGLTRAELDGAVAGLAELKLVRDKSEDIYVHMIQHLLPTGLKGIVAAALLAALMSTVSGALNSIATLFCYDIYRQWRPEASDHKLVTLGRVVTFVAMVLSILWTPYIARFENIYKGANSLICYIAPPITVVFLWGVFWRRASARGAFATLVIGSLLGLTVFLLEWFKGYTGWSVNFMMAAFYLFVACSAILVVVSLLRPQPADHPGNVLVWKHPLEALRGEAWRGIGNYKFLAGLLFITMVALYIIFR